MSNYYNLKIKEVVKETEEASTFYFQQPADRISYKPGQFLTLILKIDNKEVRRSYSLCTAPHEENLAVTVKRVANGKISNYLIDGLNPGATIQIMEPMGNFTFVPDPNKKRDIVLIGAGSGITPLMSILKSALSMENESNVSLIYGNGDEDSIIFREKL